MRSSPMCDRCGFRHQAGSALHYENVATIAVAVPPAPDRCPQCGGTDVRGPSPAMREDGDERLTCNPCGRRFTP